MPDRPTSPALGDSPAAPHPAWFVAAVLAGVVAGLPTLASVPAGGHDIAAVASVSARVLAGERLYTDLPQPNTPLVFYLEAIPYWVADQLGTDPMWAIACSILLLHAALTGLLAWTTRRLAVPETGWVQVGWVAVVSLVASGYDTSEIGQREPLYLLALLPWITTAVARRQGRAVPLALGAVAAVVAALGTALKPQLILGPLLVEAWLLARTRDLTLLRRPELVAAAAVWSAWHAWVVLGTDYVANVVQWADGYQRFGALAPIGRAGLARQVAELTGWAVLPFVLQRWRTPGSPGLRALQEPLVLVLLALGASAYLQGKGFAYHLWPLSALGVLLWWLAGAARVGRTWTAPLGVAVVAWMTWAAGIGHNDAYRRWAAAGFQPYRLTFECGVPPDRGYERLPCYVDGMAAEVSRFTEPGDRVAFVWTEVHPVGWAAVRAGVLDAVSVSPLLLPDCYTPEERFTRPFPYHEDGARGPIEQAVLDGLVRDLERFQPEVVLIDDRAVLFGWWFTDFRLTTFYLRDPRISAILDAAYTRVSSAAINHAAATWVRNDRLADGGEGLTP